ncbi:LysE family translocator [Paludibacterium purpuratum]|uniref:Threonine/homoserine/homoserine lactone efflux protein n=1 Tax=Paludibacterium purpuratum TaxID=1144873 RepID=A0A4R7AYD7_9NEIS|nr:LysE family transporter [Paludibacterium purpuratum]TDR72461.1 threonine/homoserine/homoserine lactone efflux protein [Paludibacterium purpuratum]
MTLNIWLLFVTTTFFVSAAPGPNMLLAMTHGIHYGVRATVITCLGLMVGLLLYILVSAAGLGALLTASPRLFAAVSYLGAAFLVYLGIRSWRAAPVTPEAARAAGGMATLQRFRHGFFVALSNPKAVIFFTALFPQFMNPHSAQLPQLAILTVSFYAIEACWQFAYASGGARLSGWLQSPRHIQLVNRLSGGAFICAGIVLTGVSHH